MILHPFTVSLRAPARLPVDLETALLYAACAVVVGALTLRRPALGVAALLVLAPFDVARYVGPTTITTLKAGLIGMLVALAYVHADLIALRTFPVRAMLAAFAFALAAIALSGLHALHPGAVLREGLKELEYGALFLGATIAFAVDPDDRPFWRALELVVALVALSALGEYAFGAHSGLLVHGHPFPRVAGALEGPNQLAGYLEVAIPVLVARALVHRDRLLFATIVLAAFADVLTISRSGVFGTLVGVAVVVFALRPPRRLRVRWTIAAIACVAVLAFASARAGLPSGYFSLNQEIQPQDHLGNRSELWHAAIALWERSPLVGIGAGNYELELESVGLQGVRTHANSLYLQALAEQGIVGLLAVLTVFAVTISTLTAGGVRRPLVIGAVAATIALAIHQIFDDLFFFPKVASAYWLVIGVAVAEIAARQLYERRRTALAHRSAVGT